MATIKDVARLAGVSTATVSATINNSAYVSPALRERVEQAIDVLGYAPDRVAQSLKRGRTNLIGLIVADITNPYFTTLVQTVERLLEAEGFSVLLSDTDQDPHRDASCLELMKSNRVDGVILAPSVSTHGAALSKHLTMPLVLVDRMIFGIRADYVGLDNHKAAHLAVERIVSLGHEKIGIIAGPQNLTSGRERYDGAKKSLKDFRIGIRNEYIIFCNFREEEAYIATKTLLTSMDPPTVLFVSNNLMLIGVMNALADLSLSCPEDISVVSVDDFPWASAFRPRPTVIRQPVAQIAEDCVHLLMHRISNGNTGDGETRLHVPELVMRDSLAAPRRNGRATSRVRVDPAGALTPQPGS